MGFQHPMKNRLASAVSHYNRCHEMFPFPFHVEAMLKRSRPDTTQKPYVPGATAPRSKVGKRAIEPLHDEKPWGITVSNRDFGGSKNSSWEKNLVHTHMVTAPTKFGI